MQVKWVGLVYSSFEAFTKDEEYLISLDGAPGKRKGFDYLEGFVFLDHKHVKNWRSPFISDDDVVEITKLVAEHGGVYLLEATINYCDDTVFTVDEVRLKFLVKWLKLVTCFNLF